jgi:Endonuclease/Exonuclease/phosphatase family
MKSIYRSIWVLLAVAVACGMAVADELSEHVAGVRILSWNISDDSFVTHAAEFRALIFRANADVLLLDEVSPSAKIDRLNEVIANLRSEDDKPWNFSVGVSGGRQRNVIASRAPQDALPEFSSIIHYPEADRLVIQEQMSPRARSNPSYEMDHGIPVNGALILDDDKRLLVVSADLQCCGSDHESWQEYRRRVEVREIRRRIRDVLARTPVDGIVLAGDFNSVNTNIPLVILMGPYDAPHSSLIPAEIYHFDGSTAWTWDGRGTPFPSSALDYQMYSPQSLRVQGGFILDSEDFSSEELDNLGLKTETSSQLSDHRPLVVEYVWQ